MPVLWIVSGAPSGAVPVYPHSPRLVLSTCIGAARRCVASRSARPGSPGRSARSATGALGVRCTGGLAMGPDMELDSRAMAKKDKKKSKKKDNPGTDAVGAVRTAVERTFQATAEGAGATRTRAQDLVDEVAGAAGRLREMVDQLGVLEDIKKQVEALSSRVAALERGGGSAKPAATTSRKPAASRKRATSRTPAARN